MNCRTARKLMTELFDRSPAEPPELMDHLAACPDCSRAYKQARQTIDLLKPKLSVCASPDFKDRVMKNIVNLNPQTPPSETRRSRKKIWIPAAAAAALLLIGIPYLNQFGKQGENGSLQLAQALAAEKNILDSPFCQGSIFSSGFGQHAGKNAPALYAHYRGRR